MTKTIKKTPAVLMTAIITAVSLCATAFAYVSGTGEFDVSTAAEAGGTTKVTIEYSNVDDTYNRVSDSGIDVFTTGSATTYSVSFTPSLGAATEVMFGDDPSSVYATVSVPKQSSGMPSTFSATVTLEPYTSYAINMVSKSSSVNTSGTFIIYGLDGVE